MSLPPETVTVASEGLTLSLIIWRRFRRARPGLVERVLDLNPGLAEAGPVLPVGTTFVLPIDPDPPPNAPRVVSLWD